MHPNHENWLPHKLTEFADRLEPIIGYRLEEDSLRGPFLQFCSLALGEHQDPEESNLGERWTPERSEQFMIGVVLGLLGKDYRPPSAESTWPSLLAVHEVGRAVITLLAAASEHLNDDTHRESSRSAARTALRLAIDLSSSTYTQFELYVDERTTGLTDHLLGPDGDEDDFYLFVPSRLVSETARRLDAIAHALEIEAYDADTFVDDLADWEDTVHLLAHIRETVADLRAALQQT